MSEQSRKLRRNFRRGVLVCSAPQQERLPFLRYPLRFTRISSGFSRTRLHPLLKRTRPHRGVDFVAPRGTPVRAVAAGRVTYAGWLGGLGRVVRIQHPGPYRSDYGHLDLLTKAVKLGRTVKRGQVIGYVGATGLATGPHLHFGLSKHGRYINPLAERLPRLAARAPAKKSQPLSFRRNHTQQASCRTNES
jgi:murein DD-endopeptidase MepM/ murein hydrolase activator NlpD